MSTHNANVTINLDGQGADTQLASLEKKARQLRSELNKMKISKDPGIKAKAAELDKVDKKIKSARTATLDFNRVMKNLSGATFNELKRTAANLDRELKKLPRTTKLQNEAWQRKRLQLVAVNRELAKTQLQMKGVSAASSFMTKITSGFQKYFMIFATLTASVIGLVTGLRKVVEVFNDFEEALANLSSLTGLTGENINWLRDQAKELSVATLEGGVRVRQSAKDILDAYTLIGSKMPILLQNKEALNEVTKAAIILSESGKISLEAAASSMAAAINQFGLEASSATELINLFAAASQKGAGNIQYIGDSVTNFGAAAKSMGMDIIESTIAVELLAKGGLEASVAGTGMKTFLLRSAMAAKEFNVEAVGLYKVLENMNKAQLTTIQLQQMFGNRGFMVAAILKDNVAEYKRLEEGIVNTNTAMEMAATNSDTNAAKLQQAKNKAQLLRIEMGEKLAPALTFSTNQYTYLLKAMKFVIEFFGKNKEIIIPLTQAYITYIVVLNLTAIKKGLLTIATKAYSLALGILIPQKALAKKATLALAIAYNTLTGNLTRAAAAKKLFSAIVLKTPWGIVLAGVTALTIGIVTYISRKKQATQEEKAHQRILDETNRKFDNQAGIVTRLSKTITDMSLPMQQRTAAIKEMNRIMPTYNAYLNEEGKLVGHNTTLIQEYIDALRKKIFIKAHEEELTDLYAKAREANKKILAARELEKKALEELKRKQANPSNTFEVVMRYQLRWERAGKKITKEELGLADIENAISSVEKAVTVKYSEDRFLATKLRIEEINKILNSPTTLSTTRILELREELERLNEVMESPIALLTIEIDTITNQLQFPEQLTTKKVEELKEKLKELQKEKWKLENPKQPREKGWGPAGDELGAYAALNKEIKDLQESLQNLTAEGKVRKAMDVSKALKSLEAYKRVLDGIIEHGGSKRAYMKSVTDSTKELADEAALDAERFNTLIDDIAKKTAPDVEKYGKPKKDLILDRINLEMEQEEILDIIKERNHQKELDRIEGWRNAYIDMGFSIINGLDQIFANGRQGRNDAELAALTKQRDAALDSEKLTATERKAIEEQYLEEEAKLKTTHWEKDRDAKAITSIINTALAVTEALATPWKAAAIAVAGGLQTAAILAQPVPQFYEGKYPVIGEKDGKLYNARPMKTQTGLYKEPALIADKGPELIIDSPTYKNLMINAPEIIEGIYAHRVPQYYSGKYNDNFQGETQISGKTKDLAKDEAQMIEWAIVFINAVKKFDEITKRGIFAKISLFELKEKNRELDKIENETSLKG